MSFDPTLMELKDVLMSKISQNERDGYIFNIKIMVESGTLLFPLGEHL